MRNIILIISIFALTPLFASNLDDVKVCLENWKENPFSRDNPKFRVVAANVRVMGIGAEMADQTPTSKPELVLIKPNVSVMSKSVMRLLNPNGWYCLKGKVDVMAKTEIELHCKAHLTASNSGATVMGSDANETGVTVLGKTVVQRVDCKD